MQHTEKFERDTPLVLNAHAKLSGRVEWEVVRGGERIQRGEQPNLITNLGMDDFANAQYNTGSSGGQVLSNWRSQAAIGQGTSEPDVTDTALEASVQTVSTSSSTQTGVHDVPNNVANYSLRQNAQFNIGNYYNITEFMFGSGGGAANIRELFRDGAGTPVVINLQPDDQLNIYHYLEITIGPLGTNVPASLTINEYDRDDNFLGSTTYDGWASFKYAGYAVTGIIQHLYAFAPGASMAATHRNSSGFWTSPMSGVPISNASTPSSGQNGPVMTQLGYTPGTYSRRRRWLVPAGDLNYETVTGLQVSPAGISNNHVGAFAFIIDPESANPSFSKANTHTFEIFFEVSWGRA